MLLNTLVQIKKIIIKSDQNGEFKLLESQHFTLSSAL